MQIDLLHSLWHDLPFILSHSAEYVYIARPVGCSLLEKSEKSCIFNFFVIMDTLQKHETFF